MSSSLIARLSRSTGLVSTFFRTHNVTAKSSVQSIGFPIYQNSFIPPQPHKNDVLAQPATTSIVGDVEEIREEMLTMNRNMREPRKANHGARPCSNVRRKRRHKTRANEHPYIPSRRKKGYDY